MHFFPYKVILDAVLYAVPKDGILTLPTLVTGAGNVWDGDVDL